MTGDSRLNAPNILTLLRILAIPVVVLILLPPAGREISFARSVAAFSLFVVATITDLFDGYIARRYHMVTTLGKLLDPLADKLLVCAAMIMLIPPGRVPAWMAVIVVAREIGVTALRGVASTEGVIIAASKLGKAKTLLLNIGVGGPHPPLPDPRDPGPRRGDGVPERRAGPHRVVRARLLLPFRGGDLQALRMEAAAAFLDKPRAVRLQSTFVTRA